MTKTGQSPAQARTARGLFWILASAGLVIVVALIVTILQSSPRFVILYEVGILVCIVVALVLLGAGRTSMAGTVFLMGWTGLLLASLASPAAAPMQFVVLPYLILPVILAAGTLFSPGASLVAFGIVSLLYGLVIVLKGGVAAVDLAATETNEASYLIVVLSGGLILATLAWLWGREMARAVTRADESAAALNAQIDAMAAIVSASIVAATRIAGLADLLARGADSISTGAAKIGEVGETVAAGAVLQVGEVSRVARFADTLGEATQGISRATFDVNRAVVRSGELVTTASQTLEELRAQLGAIEKVVATANKISGRTQLLAINAAIEASRAGEAGLGFSAVAEGVQMLAEQSASSAREIGAISRQVRESLGPVLASMADVEAGARQSHTLTEQVVALTEQQAAASEDVLSAVARIAEVAESNATATQGIGLSIARQADSASAAQGAAAELVAVAASLQQAIAGQLDQVASLCPNIASCPIFSRLCCGDAEETFVGRYCIGAYVDCARKQRKDAGQAVPRTLLPDGSSSPEEAPRV